MSTPLLPSLHLLSFSSFHSFTSLLHSFLCSSDWKTNTFWILIQVPAVCCLLHSPFLPLFLSLHLHPSMLSTPSCCFSLILLFYFINLTAFLCWFDWLNDCLMNWLVNWLMNWFAVDWFVDWLIVILLVIDEGTASKRRNRERMNEWIKNNTWQLNDEWITAEEEWQ